MTIQRIKTTLVLTNVSRSIQYITEILRTFFTVDHRFRNVCITKFRSYFKNFSNETHTFQLERLLNVNLLIRNLPNEIVKANTRSII